MKAQQENVQEFSAGMEVPESGIYHALHNCSEPSSLVLIVGQTFPSCPECDAITFREVRTAAYIRDDADFQSEKK